MGVQKVQLGVIFISKSFQGKGLKFTRAMSS